MNTDKQTLIGGVLVLLLLIGIGWYVITKNTGGAKPEVTQNATSTEGLVSGFVGPIAQDVSTPAPSLERPIPETSDIPDETRAMVLSQLSVTIEALKEDPKSFDEWIELGLERKRLGDYEGAAEAWEYVSLLYPGNIVSFANLGDLYMNFLHDYAKAEERYLKAIKNKPDPYIFSNLFDLYRVYKAESEGGIDILKKGIVENPGALELYIMLARAYRDAGRIDEASIAFDEAIAVAQRQNNTSAVASLKEEKADL